MDLTIDLGFLVKIKDRISQDEKFVSQNDEFGNEDDYISSILL